MYTQAYYQPLINQKCDCRLDLDYIKEQVS